VAEARTWRRIPAHGDKEIVDVTGAGDTVGAAWCWRSPPAPTWRRGARVANVAGALKVQKVRHRHRVDPGAGRGESCGPEAT
jgi:bifunctional ADP-heptose synthase (sugar kinase/adenylyltransferase)